MTTDVVKIADSNKKGKYQYHGTFNRPYFTHGPEDEVSSEIVKVPDSNGSDVEYTVTSPKNGDTKVSPAVLYKAALDYYTADQEANVKDIAKRVDPMLLFLSDAENGRV